MAATAAKVAAQVAPNIVTGGIVAEAGPRPDFSHWTVEDDILLKNSVEAGAAMEALAKGAVRFSRRFSVKELRERWRALLYDPVVAKEAAARIVEAESALADSSRAKVPNKLKDMQELVRKRRLNSVRTKYYKMRKRIAADKLVSVDQKQDMQTMDAVQGASSHCESVEAPGGKELHSLDQVTHEDLALDLEERTFSHMFSLLAAGGVGAVIGALPAVASAEGPGNSSGADAVFLLPLGNGQPEFTVATNVMSSIDHNNDGLVGPEPSPCQALEATRGVTETLVVRGVNNAEDTTTMAQEQDIVRGVEIAEDTTILASEQDIAVPGMPFSVGVQVSPAESPLRHLSGKVQDQTLVPAHVLSGEAVQAHPVLCPSDTVEISTEGEFCLSNTGAIPVQPTWFKSNEPLRNGIYVAGASFCSDGAKDADLNVDKRTESLGRQVQLPECETEKAANNRQLHNELKRPESEHCDVSEYFDRSLWPHQLVLHKGEDPVRIDGEMYSGSGDDSSAFSERQVDCAFDDLEPNESPSGMVERMWVESPPACATGVFAGAEALIRHESLKLPELTVPVPSICVLNTEDTDIPSLDGFFLSPSSSQSSFFLSQDEWESWSEGLTTDASEVSKCADGNGPQSGAGDASDMSDLNQGLLHGFLESCKMNGGGVPEAGVGTGLCSLLTRSDADHAGAQSMCEALDADVDARQCQEFQAQQPDEREVIGAQFGVGVAPYTSELEATYDVGVGNFVTDTNATISFANSEVVGSGTDWQNGDLIVARLPPQLEGDQPVQEMKDNEVYEELKPAAHEYQEFNSEDELSSDLDMARFSDVEAMILDMDLDPGFDDEFSARAESRRNYRRHSRTLIRLEQGASSAIQRSLTLHGAIAILYGYQARYFITKAEVLLGRATQDNVVDIDLTEEGRANKVSRRQAYIKLKEDGVFYLKNLGRRGLTVNNNAVQFNQRAILGSNCLIEVGGMRFIFEINHKLVKSRVPKLRPA